MKQIVHPSRGFNRLLPRISSFLKSVVVITMVLMPPIQALCDTPLNHSFHLSRIPVNIKGKITDNKGAPLPGATILIKGTKLSTQSDAQGAFSLQGVADNAVLLISYTGFITREIPVSGKMEFNITLVEDVPVLENIVVIGYGTQKKSDVTGAVVTLRGADLNKGGTNTSVAQLIQGRGPGVQVTQSSSAPGGGVSIRIRGSGSINAGNEPLYVVDGFPIDNTSPIVGVGQGFTGSPPPMNPLNALNPADIESVEILKDASATAIYGSRGANGVVLITTKKGTDGKMNIDYTITGTSASVLKKMDLLSTDEYVKVMNELAEARGAAAPFTSSYGAGTDWQDLIFRDAFSQDHNLSLSGGSGKTTFYTSLNYNKQNGVLINTDFTRFQGRVNIEHQASDKLRFGINFNTSQLNNTEVPTNGDRVNQEADAINASIVTPPIFPVYNPDGSYFRPESAAIGGVTVDNPLALANGALSGLKTNRSIGNIFGEYQLIPELSVRLTLASDRSNSRKDSYLSTITNRGLALAGGANILTGELSNSLLEGLLNYKKNVGKHQLTALAGYTYQQFDMRRFNAAITGFPSDVTGTNSLQLGDTNTDDLNSLTTRRRLLSYLARVNYGFNGKYLLTASFRADGSSNFGANNPYGYFPSFSAAWRLSEEAFIRSSNIFSDLKLRLGYGQIGNDDIGIGNAFNTFGNGPLATFGSTQFSTVTPNRIPNPDLKWETTAQYNAGIDFGVLDGRVTGSVDYFVKTTKDLLIQLPIPTLTGFNTVTQNIGEIRNSGLELLLNSKNLTGAFKWNTSFNIATLKNEVLSTGPVPSVISGIYGTTAIARPGDPLFAYYGYEAEGIFQTAEEVAASAQSTTAVPGVPKWRDLNADGKIDASDRTILGKSIPDFTFGLNNTFSYKNFDLSVFIDGAEGFSLFNFALYDSYNPNDPYRNRLAEPMLNRWTPANPTNSWPSGVDPTKYGAAGNVNSFTVMDASYIRIKNVQLSYRLPVDGLKFVRALVLTVSGQNLKTFTDYLGFDPDINSTASSIVRVDRGAYPPSRTLSFGLNVKF